MIGIISGGFDPLHVGHIRYIAGAYKHVNEHLIVILNNDNWLKAKKKYCFYPQEEREEILKSLHWAMDIRITNHRKGCKDLSICDELRAIRKIYQYEELVFIKGGDRTATNIPEMQTCAELGILTLFGVGGGKVQSSSEAVKRANKCV